MTSATRRQLANRVNCLRSTGPRSAAGRARSAQNAIKLGLFSRLLVLSALGETAEDCDAFRMEMVADLAPVGALEAELADRVALLLWRLRRVTRYESAAMAAAVGPLPPHPDEVTPMTGNALYHPLPPGAPAADRLAPLRAALVGAPNSLAGRLAEAAVLDAGRDPEVEIDCFAANAVLWAVADDLGWSVRPDPWPPVLAAAGLDAPEGVLAFEWTGARLLHVLGVVADGAGRDREELIRATRVRLHQVVAEEERHTAECREEEARLAAELLRERAGGGGRAGVLRRRAGAAGGACRRAPVAGTGSYAGAADRAAGGPAARRAGGGRVGWLRFSKTG